jgi:hypothetical protein
MVRISVLNDALKNMFNAEKRGKRQVLLKPSSKVIIKFLTVMQKHGTSPKSFFPFLSLAGSESAPERKELQWTQAHFFL